MKKFLALLVTVFLCCHGCNANEVISSKHKESKEWRKYSFYEPSIKHVTVYQGSLEPGNTAYNHCASLAFFNGKFYCIWDSHVENFEGKDGQKILLSTSDDFSDWTFPVNFVGPGHADNHLVTPQFRQWQPNLVNYKDKELWCFWYLCSEPGTYMSYLTAQPGAKWVNRKLFDTYQIPADDVSTHAPEQTSGFPSQNPILLDSGRVLVPLTFNGHVFEQFGKKNYKCRWNAVLYSDDDGKTWEVSNGVSLPNDMNAMWEPHVYQQKDGKLRMFMRNRTSQGMDPKMRMLTTTGVGAEKGQKVEFDPDAQFSFVETLNTRMHVIPLSSGRYTMIMQDVYTPDRCYHARINGALYFSRSGENDYVAGPRFSPRGEVIMYPQGIEYDNKIYVVYTLGDYGLNHTEPLSIGGTIIDPAPDPDKFYVWPRDKEIADFDYNKDEEYWHRTNKYIYERPQLENIDQRKAIRFRQRGCAGLETDVIDFANGQKLEINMDVKITRLQDLGNLIIFSFGDQIPVRIGMPSNRSGFLYAYSREQWQKICPIELNEWLSLKVVFSGESFTVEAGENDRVTFANPVVDPSPRLYLGDGYEVDYHESNRGSEFFIDIDSLRTVVY
jgi:hypothetical protein